MSSRPHSSRPKAAFILDAEAFAQIYGSAERTALAELVDFAQSPLADHSWIGRNGAFSDVEIIYSGWGRPVMDRAFFAAFPSLKIVFYGAGSVRGFVNDDFWARGLRITCAAQANAVPVSEFTLSQIIFCLKHGWQSVAAVRRARAFVRDDAKVPGAYASTVGLISLGHTGRLVAQRLASLDVKVLAYDPYVPAAVARTLNVRLCSLEELFAKSDAISCHTPLLPTTQQMLRAHHFASMKPNAAFINTARGGIVHEAEMISVLKQRTDLLAVLDVTDPEPPSADCPLFDLPNVVLTPHIAGSIGPECRRMGRMMVEETRRYLAGETLVGELRPEQLALLA